MAENFHFSTQPGQASIVSVGAQSGPVPPRPVPGCYVVIELANNLLKSALILKFPGFRETNLSSADKSVYMQIVPGNWTLHLRGLKLSSFRRLRHDA